MKKPEILGKFRKILGNTWIYWINLVISRAFMKNLKILENENFSQRLEDSQAPWILSIILDNAKIV